VKEGPRRGRTPIIFLSQATFFGGRGGAQDWTGKRCPRERSTGAEDGRRKKEEEGPNKEER